MAVTRELVRVEFHGDTLEAVQQDGKVWVSLRRCCENLGLAMESQLAKLRSKSWCSMTEIVMDSPDGSQRKIVCVEVETLPGWLFSIDARKVKENIREKLGRYQREAAKVLADHFLRRPTADAGYVTVGQLHDLLAAQREELRGLIASHSLPAPGTSPGVPRFTVAERLRFKNWLGTGPKTRERIRKLANAILYSRHEEGPDLIGGTSFWFGHQLGCLDEAIDRVQDEMRAAEKVGASLPGTV